MFCLRSWLPLLFIPTNASPIFVLTFFLLTYYLNRPCVYCSILLAILFASSCYWSESCWFDATTATSTTTSTTAGGVTSSSGSTTANSISNGLGLEPGLGIGVGLGSDNSTTTTTTMGYNWFEPRYFGSALPNPLLSSAGAGGEASPRSGARDAMGGEEAGFLAEVISSTVWGLGGAAVKGVQQKSGIGLGWVRRLLGSAQWRVPGLDVDVRL